uniref:Uncharacterized protein n=1 Tax=Rhizobium leguminosarum TaxID=384 RepID=A0A179BBH4_RHILE|nr:hypothetical protein [Rhizobium leguminosarum]OAP89072.1 hypothetical protein A4U53_33490 [Rhizobium leguminosarum]
MESVQGRITSFDEKRRDLQALGLEVSKPLKALLHPMSKSNSLVAMSMEPHWDSMRKGGLMHDGTDIYRIIDDLRQAATIGGVLRRGFRFFQSASDIASRFSRRD